MRGAASAARGQGVGGASMMTTWTLAVARPPASLKPSTVTVYVPGTAKVTWKLAGGAPAPLTKLSPASLKWSKSVNAVVAGVDEVTRNLTGLFFSSTLVGSTVIVAVGAGT